MKRFQYAFGIIIVFLSLLHLTSCSTIKYLEPFSDDNSVTLTNNGSNKYLRAETETLDISVTTGDFDNGTVAFYCVVTNKTNRTVFFNSSDFAFYYYSPSTNLYKLINIWDPELYYKNALKELKRNEFLNGVAGALNIFNSFFGTVTYTQVNPGGHRSTTYITRSHNYSNVYSAILLADTSSRIIKEEGRAYLDYLKNEMLYSKPLNAGETYAGWIFFEDELYKDEYMLLYSEENNEDTLSNEEISTKQEIGLSDTPVYANNYFSSQSQNLISAYAKENKNTTDTSFLNTENFYSTNNKSILNTEKDIANLNNDSLSENKSFSSLNDKLNKNDEITSDTTLYSDQKNSEFANPALSRNDISTDVTNSFSENKINDVYNTQETANPNEIMFTFYKQEY